jgi:hypothetical protein
MIRPWDNKYSAKERYLAAFGRFFLNIFNLGIFYGTTTKFLGSGVAKIEQEWQHTTKEAFASPDYNEFFEKNPIFSDETLRTGLCAAFAKASTRLSTQAVESATLIFAHTILDETLSECCRISFMASPKDWLQFVSERKVKLGEVKSIKAISQKKTWEYVFELQRESINQRFDILHRVCAPRLDGAKLPTAWISREKLERFDQLRHRVIHGRRFLRKTPQIEDQIQFAKQSGFSTLILVVQAYGLLKNKKVLPRNSSLLRLLVVARQEFPELVELLDTMVKSRTEE